jgi:hypothetical protein
VKIPGFSLNIIFALKILQNRITFFIMTIAKVRVVQGIETLLAWRGINIQSGKTIKELFEHVVEQYIPKLYDEVLESIITRSSSQKEEIGDIIEMDCFAEEVVKTFGAYLTFKLSKNYEISRTKSAFDIMKAASQELYLPEFKFSVEPNKTDQIKQEILAYITENQGGWRFEVIDVGKRFINDLTKAFWYVDQCGPNTFSDRYTLPDEFLRFFYRFDPKKSKKARLHFEYDTISFHSQNLQAYLNMSWIQSSAFTFFRLPLNKFAGDLQSYAEYLVDKSKQTAKNHESLIPIVNEVDAGKLKIFSPQVYRDSKIREKYQNVVNVIQQLDFWIPLNIDNYCPQNRS